MTDELRSYFRDVHDHARRVDEQVPGQRELLRRSWRPTWRSSGVQQNAVVRAISALGGDHHAVPTFLASIWGMNFEHMPELDMSWGYPLALAMMVVAVVVLYRFFKRIEWL